MATVGETRASLDDQATVAQDTLAVGGGYVAPVSGRLASGWTHFFDVTAGGTSEAFRMAIYEIPSGLPGALIGLTDQRVLTSADVYPAWFEFPGWTNFGGPPSVVIGHTYWIGLWGGAQANGFPRVDHATAGPGAAYFDTTETYSATGNPPHDLSQVGAGAFSAYFDIVSPSVVGQAVTRHIGSRGAGW